MSDTKAAEKPAEKAVASGRAMREPRTIALKKTGVTVVYDAGFTAADSIAAQRAAGKDSARFVLYLLQRIATFDGAVWTAPEIEEQVKGMDYLTLQGAVLSDEDGPGEGGPGKS